MNLTETLQLVNKAAQQMQLVSTEAINSMLLSLADEAEKETPFILAENQKDLDRMSPDDPKYDRLQLTADRIKGIAGDIRNVSGLPSPLGKTLAENTQTNGLKIKRVSVPIGVIGIIYEARPNVTFDVFSLCIKSGNACVLKGGSDAEHSNIAIASIIHRVLQQHGMDKNIVALMPADRETTTELLKQDKYLDMIIPRGSQGLIDHVRKTSSIPVIETGAGICHTYFDLAGDLAKGKRIVFNAKTRRVSVCNALDCLVVHKQRLSDLPELVADMASEQVVIYADEQALLVLQGYYDPALLKPATSDSFGTEFLSYKMAIKVVSDLDEAIEHITKYTSKHSEAIISEDQHAIDRFFTLVDAAAVYANTSTAFTDGAQFGLGAEIGISTQKLHARGPMALAELTSYKWMIVSDGQVRSK